MTLAQERKKQVRESLVTLADCFRVTDTKTLCEVFRQFPNLSACIQLILDANMFYEGGDINVGNLDLKGD